jgi:hypothetical protein
MGYVRNACRPDGPVTVIVNIPVVAVPALMTVNGYEVGSVVQGMVKVDGAPSEIPVPVTVAATVVPAGNGFPFRSLNSIPIVPEPGAAIAAAGASGNAVPFAGIAPLGITLDMMIMFFAEIPVVTLALHLPVLSRQRTPLKSPSAAS